MNMNYKKIGAFITKLRKEQKMTQEALAKLLYVERETVSKWERGVNNINSDNLLKMCNIFNITFNEMVLCERINKNNVDKINNVTAEIINKNKKIKKYLISSIVLIIILIASFLGYYFINNYNSIKVYGIISDSEDFIINDGIMTVFNDKIYIQLSNNDNVNNYDIISSKLYYEKNNEKILIYETVDSNLGMVYVSNYIDSIIKYEDLKYIISNTFLEIIYDSDKISTQQLNFVRSYSNKNIFAKKKQQLENSNINELNNKAPEYIKDNFKYDKSENIYYLEENNQDKKITQKYFNNIGIYIVYEISDNYKEEYTWC